MNYLNYETEQRRIYKEVFLFKRGLYSFNITAHHPFWNTGLSLRYYVGEWTIPTIENSLLYAMVDIPCGISAQLDRVAIYEGIGDVVTNISGLILTNILSLEQVKRFWENPQAYVADDTGVMPLTWSWKNGIVCTRIKLLRRVKEWPL